MFVAGQLETNINHSISSNNLSNESYVLENRKIEDAEILFKYVYVFIANSFLINSRLTFHGNKDNKVLLQNCSFQDSEIIIKSTKHCSIESSQFSGQHVAKRPDPSYMLSVYDTDFTHIWDSVFGGPGMEIDEGRNLSTEHTRLGIKLENVSLATIANCTFHNLMSEVNNGSALHLRTTEVFIERSEFRSNSAKYGVIFADRSAKITSVTSAFISNHAHKSGGVYALSYNSSLTNRASVFQNNTAREFGGVLHAKNSVLIKNYYCVFESNIEAVYMTDNCSIQNVNTDFIGNTVNKGYGSGAPAIFGQELCNVTNINTKYLNNVGYDGTIRLEKEGHLLNNASFFR